MAASITLDIDENDIIKTLGKEIVREINRSLYGIESDSKLRTDLELLIEAQIRNTPEYEALLNGELAAIFGLTNPAPVLNAIIDTVKNSMVVDFQPAVLTSAGIKASVSVFILVDDFSDVLAVSGAGYDSDGGYVDWLNWLLKAGDRVVVVDYDVVFGSSFVGSRSDFAIMEKNVGKGFRVPPEYSGTPTNNWLTRAFEDAEDIVGNILFIEVHRRLS